MRCIRAHAMAIFAVLLAHVFVPAARGVELLVNGDFEQGPAIPAANPLFTLAVGSTALTGWTVVGGAITIVTDNYWAPLSGARSVELSSGNGPGGIEQTFDTAPGAVYRLTYWLTGEAFSTPTLKTLRVTAAATQQDFVFDITPVWHWDMAWSRRSLDFTATATTTTLRFAATDASPWGAAVDSARVEFVSTDVPTLHTFSMSRVSPNPVRFAGRVAFTLAAAGHARLAVHDVQGREVAVLADGDFGAGPQGLSFEPRRHGVGAGVYFAVLRTGGHELVRRFVVL